MHHHSFLAHFWETFDLVAFNYLISTLCLKCKCLVNVEPVVLHSVPDRNSLKQSSKKWGDVTRAQAYEHTTDNRFYTSFLSGSDDSPSMSVTCMLYFLKILERSLLREFELNIEQEYSMIIISGTHAVPTLYFSDSKCNKQQFSGSDIYKQLNS